MAKNEKSQSWRSAEPAHRWGYFWFLRFCTVDVNNLSEWNLISSEPFGGVRSNLNKFLVQVGLRAEAPSRMG